MVIITIEMFNAKTLEGQLKHLDKLCDYTHNRYRGRLPSCLIDWFQTNHSTLEKLNIDETPANHELSLENLERVSKLNLRTKRDKAEFKRIIEQFGGNTNWIVSLIPEVSHKEFNTFLYVAAVLSRENLYKGLEWKQETVQTALPSIKHLKEIGTYDCHSGRGTFNDFLEKGMVVENMAPNSVKFLGKSTKELENIYLKIAQELGCERYS